MTTSRDRRYPLGPLLMLTGWSMQQVRRHSPCNGTEYATRLVEGVTERTADRLAVEAGLTPWLVWADWLADVGVVCADDDCDVVFFPARKDHIYCKSGTCPHGRKVKAATKRARYASDDAFAEKLRAEVRRYGAECRPALAAQQRRYKERNREPIAAQQHAYYLANRDRILAAQRVRDARQRAA